MKFTLATIVAAIAGSTATAQVVINEVYENPPGGSAQNDAVLEYIELYGFPGMDLTGYAVVLFKGGSDTNGDNIPEETPEIDEAFSLDGLSIGTNGFLILYNGTPAQSLIPLFLPNQGETAASFFQTHIPSPFDINGNLGNDFSSTYSLIRRRPHHSIVNDQSVYAPGYAVWKDADQDVTFSGRFDFGFEAPTASRIDPLQVIDDIAWSNEGGKEYVRSSQQEISDTPGFNPDGISRLAFYGSNPNRGLRINSQGQTVPTRMADEEWIYGDLIGPSTDFRYDPIRYGAPTDPGGDGFQDISIGAGSQSFRLTPGTFNDYAPLNITQFRFILGDLNFDGLVNAADLALFDAQLLGADFDATHDYIHPDTGNPIPDPNNPGQNLQSYIFQSRLANSFLAATNLDTTDGPGGTNAPSPTLADRAVLAALVGPVPCSPADFSTPYGTLDFFDVSAFLAAFSAQNPAADLNNDGNFDFFDVQIYLAAFAAGCP
ncbi:MAG: hypothetical protein KF757_02855 [Phycisphaeraceae bacterium]|nr:hypothetical protein [Phycisphaeraceae bacterium]MCW5762121.1 hypothetical protein [Phycisphaeraceae bacterium]